MLVKDFGHLLHLTTVVDLTSHNIEDGDDQLFHDDGDNDDTDDKQDEVDGIRAGAGEANSCNYDCADGNYSSIDFMTATSSGIIQEKGESEEDDDSYDEEER